MRRVKTEKRIQAEYERFVRACAREEQRTGRSFEAETTRMTDRVTASEMLATLAARVRNLGRTAAKKASVEKPKFGWMEEE